LIFFDCFFKDCGEEMPLCALTAAATQAECASRVSPAAKACVTTAFEDYNTANTRSRFASYREALPHALAAARRQAKLTQRINSLAQQAASGASVAATKRPSSWRCRSALPYAS
jgi:hypothetical protein